MGIPRTSLTRLATAVVLAVASAVLVVDGSPAVATGCSVSAASPACSAPSSRLTHPAKKKKRSQTIHFTSHAPSPALVGVNYDPHAKATSKLRVRIGLGSASKGCSLNAGVVRFTGAGTCIIRASQGGNKSYKAARAVYQSVAVTKYTQSIAFISPVPSSPTVGGTYKPTAAATSGLPVTITRDSSSTGCTFSSGTFTFAGGGPCTVEADQKGNAEYGPAPRVKQVIQLPKLAQTITFSSTAPAHAVVGDTYRPAASASTHLTVKLGLTSASTNCTMTSGLVTFTGSGTCVVTADQAGNAEYSAAPQVVQSIQVVKKTQTVSFTSMAPSPALVDATYHVTATASSGLAVTFTLDASSAGCTLSSGVVTFTAGGTCVVDADQVGNTTYGAAAQVLQSIPVTKKSQTISITSTIPSPALVGNTYTPVATATSDLAVTFTKESDSAICSVSSGVVTFNGAGTCVIDAGQAGNGAYLAATTVQQSIQVLQKSQSVSFSSTPPSPAYVGGTYTLVASSTSLLPVAYTLDGTSSGCSLSGEDVTFTAVGTCVVDANQVGNATYSGAVQVQQTFAIDKQGQTISITSSPPSPGVVGSTYDLVATATSGLTVAFTQDPASAGCSLSGNELTFTGAGTCVVDADQPGNGAFTAAPQLKQSIQVVKQDQTVSFTSTPPSPAVAGSTYDPAAAATSTLDAVISLDPGSAGCSLSNGEVTFTGAGTCVLDADQPGSAAFSAAPQAQQSIQVVKQDQTVSFTSTAPSPGVAGSTYDPTATATSTLDVGISLDGTSTGCSLSNGEVTFTAAGTCVLDADQPGNAAFSAAPRVTQSISVVKADQTVSFTSTAPTTATIDDVYSPQAAATSGLDPAITLDGTSSGCSLDNGDVTFTGVGTCVIDADQAGNGAYNAAPQVQQSISVVKKNQTISFVSSAPGAPMVNDMYTPDATASSGLDVTITLDPTSTGCTLDGDGVVTFTAAGTCLIDADQAGDATYTEAPQVQQSIVVN
ncbi:MAG: Endoglucanase-like protein [Marmoricola sp.]|nr:Endoglucanase-like protein [Marmoricola sp.]